jgi:hypothetical protein
MAAELSYWDFYRSKGGLLSLFNSLITFGTDIQLATSECQEFTTESSRWSQTPY